MILALALAHIHLMSGNLMSGNLMSGNLMSGNLMSGNLMPGHLVAAIVQTLPHAGPTPTPAAGGASITSVDDIGNVIKDFFRDLLRQYVPIGALLAAIYGGWGGLVHITSGGAPDMQRKARSIWWQAGTGFVGVLLSSPFVNILQSKF